MNTSSPKMLEALNALKKVIVAGNKHLILGKVFIEKEARSYSDSPTIESLASIFPKEMLASNKEEADTIIKIEWYWRKNEQRQKELSREIIRYGHSKGFLLSVSSRRGKTQMSKGQWIPDIVGQKPHPGYYWPTIEAENCIRELAKPVKSCPACQNKNFLTSPVCSECNYTFSEEENIAALNATKEEIQQEVMSGDLEIGENNSQICAICRCNTVSGSYYKIYYGNRITNDPLHSFKIAGSKDIPICHKCLLTPGLKTMKVGTVIGLVFTLFTCWTIVGGIFGLPLTLAIHNQAKERQKAIMGNDKEMQRRYLIKERKNLDAYGYRLAAKTLKTDFRNQNQSYDVFFTPEEYSLYSGLIQNDISATDGN